MKPRPRITDHVDGDRPTMSTKATRQVNRRHQTMLAVLAAVLAAVTTATVHADTADDGWNEAERVGEVNSAVADGCPIESPNGRQLFLASMRQGTFGGNDIWVAHRANEGEPWGAPEHLPAPVNTAYNDFCPTPLTGKRLLFVSERPGEQTCNAGPGVGDIYLTRLHPRRGPDIPRHLGCVSDGTGPNFDGAEFSPSLVSTDDGTWLFFSSTGDDNNQDLYVSKRIAPGRFGPPTTIVELSTPADDRMPNVSRDGLTMVFVSNRTDLPGAQGNLDVYVSHRASTNDPWSTPVNLGGHVNTDGAETRPTLSADGERLYFGRSGDIWMSTRTRGD
jgi:Tol biopolymer transport system component